mgnify:CR=1 FL=1
MSRKGSGEVRPQETTAQRAVQAMGADFPRVSIWHMRGRRYMAQHPSPKRINRWRDRRMTALLHGYLVNHRRTSLIIRHKSKQDRGLRHRHY